MAQIQTAEISIFDSTYQQEPSGKIKIQDYFDGIIKGKWQDEVLQCRAIQDEEKQYKFKIGKVHGVRLGIFSGWLDSNLIEHSGLLAIDIDAKDQSRPISEIRELLREIPEIIAIHYSIRGKGLAAYFHIRKDKHADSFEAIAKSLINDYQIIPDFSCRNVGRLRFVSYDPDCHLNFGAACWKRYEKKEERIREADYNNLIFSNNDIEFVFQQIKERRLCITPDYFSWVRIGFALASEFGEGGRNYFKIISSFWNGKEKISCDKQYDNCLRSDKGKSGGTSIKSFFYFAKQAGCSLVSERTKKISSIGKLRRRQEISGQIKSKSGKQDSKQYLTDLEGISGHDVEEILDKIWDLPEAQLKETDDSIITSIENYLKTNHKIRMNEITTRIEIDGEEITDIILNSIYINAKKIISDKVNKDLVFDIIHSNFTKSYNPILEWFEKHRHIKPSGNIDKLAECIDSDLRIKDAMFIRDFLEKWLLSLIASAHGTYSVLCLVLTGEKHGIGKTTFFRFLLPEELRWLFATSQLEGKEGDINKLMSIKWVILDDEFGGKSKKDEKKFKELISKDKFSVRAPYGRYFEDLPRLAVLCGSCNEMEVINDITGNRRIIPIQVNYIDLEKYEAIDKTDLLMEVYNLWREKGNAWFLNRADIERLNEITSDAEFTYPEMELPLKYFKQCEKNEPGSNFKTSSEIRSVIEQQSTIRLSQQKLSISLKKLGFVYDRKDIEGSNVRGFYVKEKFITNPDNSDRDKKNEDEKLSNGLPF